MEVGTVDREPPAEHQDQPQDSNLDSNSLISPETRGKVWKRKLLVAAQEAAKWGRMATSGSSCLVSIPGNATQVEYDISTPP